MKKTWKRWMSLMAVLTLVMGLGMGMACMTGEDVDDHDLYPTIYTPKDLGEDLTVDGPKDTVSLGIPIADLEQTTLETDDGTARQVIDPNGVSIQAISPGVNPNEIYLYGTAINRQNYRPDQGVDYTASVVGGVLNVTLQVPVNTYLHLGYSLAAQNRVNNITINGTALTSFGILGTAPYQWPVACFIVNRDQAGAITVGTNPNCNQVIYRLKVLARADNNNDNAYQAPYDDPMLPYNGTSVGEEQYIQTSLWRVTNPGGVWQRLVWEAAVSEYTETFFSYPAGMSSWFTIHYASRDPLAPAGTFEPNKGIWVEVLPINGGAPLCTTVLRHYEDFDLTGNIWWGARIDGLVPGTPGTCVTQGAETRDFAAPTTAGP